MARCPTLVFLVAAAAAALPLGARAQTCSASVPHVTGQWTTLPYQMPINPINATMLRTGQVLIVAGSENDARNNSPGAESYRNAIWDPTGTTESSIAVQNLEYDVFCSGTSAGGAANRPGSLASAPRRAGSVERRDLRAEKLEHGLPA